MTLPVMPEDTMPFLRVRSVKIAAIQVGIDAFIKPPGSPEFNSTAAGKRVVVAIFSGKSHATMIRKRVTSRTSSKEK